LQKERIPLEQEMESLMNNPNTIKAPPSSDRPAITQTAAFHRPAVAGLPLPVQPDSVTRLDEKYRWRDGYSDLDRTFGCDWNQQEE
jgi:hypothetical protein